MLYFALGTITGLLIATLIVATLVYFRRVIEHKATIIEKAIENAGPRPKGFVMEPPSENEELRAQIIAENKKKGKDTPINELL